MDARDFYQDWVQSALNERYDAQIYRRRGIRNNSESALWLARKAYERALYDLEQARRYRSEINAN